MEIWYLEIHNLNLNLKWKSDIQESATASLLNLLHKERSPCNTTQVCFFSSSFIKICIYRTFFSPKQDFESFKYGIVTQHKFVSFFSSSFIIICTYRKKIVTQHKFVSFFSFSVVIICTYRTFSPETIENFLPKQESLNMHLYISKYIVLGTLKDFAPEWLKSRNNNLNLDN